MTWRSKALLLLLICFCSCIQAQVKGAPPYFSYSNKLEGADNLQAFKQKLLALQEGSGLIKILHLGDSHVKSGFFSETFADSLNRYLSRLYHKDSNCIVLKVMAKNGATSRHFLADVYSAEEVKSFAPDLVIISLGTNEAQNLYTENDLHVYFDALLKQIKTDAPDASLLFTNAGDAQRKTIKMVKHKRKYYSLTTFSENKTLPLVNSFLASFAQQAGAAFWDWNKIMGGGHSVLRWIAHGYANADRVHLSEKGYQLQGTLLATAFIYYTQPWMP